MIKNKIQKWPNNWTEHIFQTCFFYFENKNISFVDSQIIYLDQKDTQKCNMKLIFKKNNKMYDIFISHCGPIFNIDYYYRNYDKNEYSNSEEKNFIWFIDTNFFTSDENGFFFYICLAGAFSQDTVISAYDIIKSIESIINTHNNDGNNDGEDGGEKDPIMPISPCGKICPELLNC